MFLIINPYRILWQFNSTFAFIRSLEGCYSFLRTFAEKFILLTLSLQFAKFYVQYLPLYHID